MFGFGDKAKLQAYSAAVNGQADTLRVALQSKLELVSHHLAPHLCKRVVVEDAPIPAESTLLHAAAMSGQLACVELLLRLKADLNALTTDHRTPLMLAVENHHPRMVELLLDERADWTLEDGEGMTPFHVAAAADQSDVLELMIVAGVDVNLRNARGDTATHIAAALRHREALTVLLAGHAEANVTNTLGLSPLHMAVLTPEAEWIDEFADPSEIAARDAEPIAKVLLKYGAEPNLENPGGETALDMVHMQYRDDEAEPLVKLLRRFGGRWKRYAHEASKAESSSHHRTRRRTRDGDEEVDASATVIGAGRGQRLELDPRNASRGADDEDEAAILELGEEPVVIGRSSDCDLRIRSTSISRKHARVDFRGDRYYITDLGSTNGTRINGEELTETRRLQIGDIISILEVTIVFDGDRLIGRITGRSAAGVEG